MEDPIFDTSLNYSDSYTPTRGANIYAMDNLGQANLFDQPTVDLVKSTVAQNLRNPGIQPMPIDQYYPDINRSINVGTYSGSLIGSVPIYAAGAGYDPVGVLEAKNYARQQKMDEYQKSLQDAMTWDYVNVKHSVLNDKFLEHQTQWRTADWDRLLQKAGGDAVVAAQLAKTDPETKLLTARINNTKSAADAMWDVANEEIANYESGNLGMWTSNKTYNMAKDFVSFLTKQDITLNDLKDFDPSKFANAMSIEKAAAQTMEMRSKENMQNITTKILEARLSGTNISLSSDKENVYAIEKTVGLSEPEVRRIAEEDYQAAYGLAIQNNEDRGLNKYEGVPDFNKDFLPKYQKLIHQQVTDTLEKVSKMSPNDWADVAQKRAATRKTQQETMQDVSVQNVIVNKGGKIISQDQWDIDSAGVDIVGGQIGLPSSLYRVVRLVESEPDARGKVSVNAVVAPYHRIQVQGVDERGNPTVEWQEVPDMTQTQETQASNVLSEVSKKFDIYEEGNGLPKLKGMDLQTLEPGAHKGMSTSTQSSSSSSGGIQTSAPVR